MTVSSFLAGNTTISCPQHQGAYLRYTSSRCRIKASVSTPTPSQTQDIPSQLTLLETQGRQQRMHTWSLTTTTSSSSSQDDLDDHNGALQLHAQPQATAQEGSNSSKPGFSTLLADRWQQLQESVQSLFLPAGYPDSVTDDYLAYQLATVPAHVTGWLSHSLTTSSLLKAVGISAGPVGATAAAAAIKWIVKDGLGAAGRLLVGGRLGQEFDDDPRRWRMTAEGLTTAGLALEIATSIYPQQFLLLASLGNFTKAVGKGMGKPVFRVIQTHFASSGNVGAVAAKEEVWEVSAQLAGYALSVLLLEQLQDAGDWETVVGIWAVVQAAHVALRYVALSQLRFRYLNQKRAKLLVSAHVRGQVLPTVAEGNQQEPLFAAAADLAPHVTLGCSIAEAWGVQSSSLLQPEVLGPWWQLYSTEGHLLVWREGHAYVVLKEGGSSQGDQQQQQYALLRALWQAAWLDAHHLMTTAEVQQHSLADGNEQQQLSLSKASLEALSREFDDFIGQVRATGWRSDQLVLKVGSSRVQEVQSGLTSELSD